MIVDLQWRKCGFAVEKIKNSFSDNKLTPKNSWQCELL